MYGDLSVGIPLSDTLQYLLLPLGQLSQSGVLHGVHQLGRRKVMHHPCRDIRTEYSSASFKASSPEEASPTLSKFLTPLRNIGWSSAIMIFIFTQLQHLQQQESHNFYHCGEHFNDCNAVVPAGAVMPEGTLVNVSRMFGMLGFIGGTLLFVILTFRAKVFPRWVPGLFLLMILSIVIPIADNKWFAFFWRLTYVGMVYCSCCSCCTFNDMNSSRSENDAKSNERFAG